jgi:Helix-turn-helix of DDE superfamily endonuclease
MRTFASLQKMSTQEFKRLTGVSRTTFDVMVAVVSSMLTDRQKKGGPRFSWSMEDMLLMALTYWREYRTYFHISRDYQISESQCFRIVKMVENLLIKDKRFHLKGKNTLLEKKEEGKYTIVDVAESPIERPQKKGEKTNKSTTILEKRNVTH